MRHWLYRDARKFYYLDGDVIVIRQNGTVHAYQSFKDNLGSILSVIDENGSKVFSAEYDAWGKQTVSVNTTGLIRGYGSHEMLNEFCLINMNGRVYDSVLGRFLSPDKYVQEGDNSQNYNSYSYCLNNPLKYADPSGNVFVLDDFIAITAMGAMMGAMNATMSDKPIWKGALIGGAMSAASYGIGSWLGHGFESFNLGNELERAGMHGLADGLLSAIDGHNFGIGFACGALSSFGGSGLQAAGLKSSFVLAEASALTGESVAWALGDDFLYGANIGYNIGAYNHGWVYDSNHKPLYYELDEVVCTAKRIVQLPQTQVFNTVSKINEKFGYAVNGFDNKAYKSGKYHVISALDCATHEWNVGVGAIEKMSNYLSPSVVSKIGKTNLIVNIATGSIDMANAIHNDIQCHTAYKSLRTASHLAADYAGSYYGAIGGAEAGAAIGACFGGVGTIPGAIVGGIVGGWGGSTLATGVSDLVWDSAFIYF